MTNYDNATHEDLLRLTRALFNLPYGDLVKLHKDKAKELGSRSPSAVWIRAVIFSRIVSGRVAPSRV